MFLYCIVFFSLYFTWAKWREVMNVSLPLYLAISLYQPLLPQSIYVWIFTRNTCRGLIVDVKIMRLCAYSARNCACVSLGCSVVVRWDCPIRACCAWGPPGLVIQAQHHLDHHMDSTFTSRFRIINSKDIQISLTLSVDIPPPSPCQSFVLINIHLQFTYHNITVFLSCSLLFPLWIYLSVYFSLFICLSPILS